MDTKFDTEKLAKLKGSLRAKFEKLQQRKRLAAFDVVDSLAEDVNAWSLSLTGEDSRQVDSDGGTAGTTFVVKDGVPYAVVVVDYLYSARTGKPIDVEFLNDIVPGIELTQDHAITSSVCGEMAFNLDSWPNLVDDLLFNKVYEGFVAEVRYPEHNAAARAQVIAMCSYYYPSMDESTWHTAASLGLLENWKGFYTVLAQHKASSVSNISIPDDVSNSL